MATSKNIAVGDQATYEKVCEFFGVTPSEDVMSVQINIEPNGIITMTETRPVYLNKESV